MNHQYVVPGTVEPEKVNYKDFPWIFEKSISGSYVCLHSINELPEEAARDKESFMTRGIKSFMFIPDYAGGIPVAGQCKRIGTYHRTRRYYHKGARIASCGETD